MKSLLTITFAFSCLVEQFYCFSDDFGNVNDMTLDELDSKLKSVENGAMKGDGMNLLSILQNLGDDKHGKCEHTCPKGLVSRPRPGHVPSADGCGSYGLSLGTVLGAGVTECCNEHDRCYDTCNSDRKECDAEFGHCLLQYCEDKKRQGMSSEEQKECLAFKQTATSLTDVLGCEAFLKSQRTACQCLPKNDSKRRLQRTKVEL